MAPTEEDGRKGAREGRQLTEAEVLLCGAVAGTASRAILNPLDVLKIRLQIQQETAPGYAAAAATATATAGAGAGAGAAGIGRAPVAAHGSGGLAQQPVASTSGGGPKYAGALDALRVIVREEGVRGLWRGIVPGLCLVVPYSAVQFLVYDAANRKCRELRMKGAPAADARPRARRGAAARRRNAASARPLTRCPFSARDRPRGATDAQRRRRRRSCTSRRACSRACPRRWCRIRSTSYGPI